MKRPKKKNTFRWKLAGVALAGIAIGAVLMFLSLKVAHSDKKSQTSAITPAATAPAAPADNPSPSEPSKPMPLGKTAAQNMSGMLFLFSLVAFAVPVICIGWIVVDIRQSRPAWKIQTKYPRRR